MDSSTATSDSQYSSSDESGDVVSLTPSITDYPMRWGRRYHKFKEGRYLLPNDEDEARRLDLQHEVMISLHKGHYFLAPVKDPRKILDIGTGTGIWSVELADSDLAPNARITGTDLSPIQPSDVPENVSFEIADCSETDWCRPRDSVDLIFARIMYTSLIDFPIFMTTAKRYLRPGLGWLECHEIDPRPRCDDGSIPPKWPLTEWEQALNKGAKKFKKSASLHAAPNLKRDMGEAGFVDVHEVIHKLPLGGWSKSQDLKRIGRAAAEVLFDGLPALSYKLLGAEGMNMSRTEIEVFLADVRKSIVNPNVHSYCNVHTVYGRRPGALETATMRKTTSASSLKTQRSSVG